MRTPIVVTLTVLLLLLAGCIPKQERPEPTPTPVFASEEEALAAAEEAYAAYLAISDLIASEGGADPERLAPYVTEDWLSHEINSFDQFRESGNHLQGFSDLISVDLQQYSDRKVLVLTCVSYLQAPIYDADGQNVTPIDRPDRASLTTSFDVREGALLVSGSDIALAQSC